MIRADFFRENFGMSFCGGRRSFSPLSEQRGEFLQKDFGAFREDLILLPRDGEVGDELRGERAEAERAVSRRIEDVFEQSYLYIIIIRAFYC